MLNFQQAFASLNPEQRLAVETIEGPLMVVAGPGTGKTQLLAVRVANILRNTQALPSNILCLTFTESGAAAMRQRLTEIIGPDAYAVNIHTFHSFCADIIHRYPEKFDFVKELRPLSEIESVAVFRKLTDEIELQECKPLGKPYFYLAAFQKALKELKREGIAPEKLSLLIEEQKREYEAISSEEIINKRTGKPKLKFLEQARSIRKNEDLAKIYSAYCLFLRSNGRYDFEDMILFVLERLKKDDYLLAGFQEQLQYLLVDEYQDTNGAQNELLQMLTKGVEQPNLMVVGDDDQAIYRFQGACLENILQFSHHYREYATVIMKENYRSGQSILDSAKQLISKNKNRLCLSLNLDKNLLAAREKDSGRIKEVLCPTGESELRFLVKEVKKLRSEGQKYSEIAVLFRNNHDADAIMDHFDAAGIPYQAHLEKNVLTEPLIQQVVKLLRLIFDFNAADYEEAFFQALNAEFWQISPIDVFKLTRSSYEAKKGIMAYLVENDTMIKAWESGSQILKLRDLILSWHKDKDNFSLPQLVEKVLKESGLIKHLLRDKSHWGDFLQIKFFFHYIQDLHRGGNDLDIKKLLYYLDLYREHNVPLNFSLGMAETEAVQVMTAHKAKGLEFETVFILHCRDKKWGNISEKNNFKLPEALLSRSLIEKGDKNEDERRLFYVALTRAKKTVYICWAKEYSSGGNNRRAIPSQFLSELAQEKTEKIDYRETQEDHFRSAGEIFQDRPAPDWDEKAQNYLLSLVEHLKISPTALNKYLLCPRKFMYDNLLRVPKTKSAILSLGTAAHKALEKLFEGVKKNRLLSLNEVLKTFESSLKKEGLAEKDFRSALKNGGQILTEYYQENKNLLREPIFTEYDFSVHRVIYEGVPITGKIDKIEFIDEKKDKVRLIDYKTGQARSQNSLLGKTQENNLDYKRQGYFYLLLTETDRFFKHQGAEVVFEFIKERKVVSLPIIAEDYQSFKEELKDAYSRLKKGDFSKADPETVCRRCGPQRKNCEYFDLCWKNKKTP